MTSLAPDVLIPEEVFKAAENSVGKLGYTLNGAEPEAIARDHLDTAKSVKRAEILQKYTSLTAKKLLEVGSGFGTNLIVWSKLYHIDGYGIEHDSSGFESSFESARRLFEVNGLDPKRITNGTGEKLPFEDNSFDIVYSANVLEHTDNPRQVLMESLRVLRKGGILHVEVPNFLSYFEGHYMVLMPPLFGKWLLPFWLRLLGKDPAFAYTLRTEINPLWCRKTIRDIQKQYPCTLLSLGEEEFMARLSAKFCFETGVTASRLTRIIRLIQKINKGNWIGRIIVALKGHFPIYLTVRRD